MRWVSGKKGQPEHIFSDAIPGIILVFIGVIVISVAHTDVYDGLQKNIDERVYEKYAERQLVEYLESEIEFRGETKKIWEVIVLGENEVKKTSEIGSSGFGMESIFLEDYVVLESFAFEVFDEVIGNGLWYIIVDYIDLEENVEMGHAGECGRMHGRLDKVSLDIIGSVEVSLQYCIRE